MDEEATGQDELPEKIDSLQKEVSELRKMLVVVASSVAMIEGMEDVTHTYLRRALAELESTSLAKLKEEYLLSDEFTPALERGLDLMAEEAREMNLTDLAEHLEE